MRDLAEADRGARIVAIDVVGAIRYAPSLTHQPVPPRVDTGAVEPSEPGEPAPPAPEPDPEPTEVVGVQR